MSRPIRDAYHEWIDGAFTAGSALSLTLNFKQRLGTSRLTQKIATDTIRRFKHALRRRAFGSRRASLLTDEFDLNFVAAFEGNVEREEGIPLHCHALLEVPPGKSVDVWRTLCEEQWMRLDWADPKNHRFDDYWSSGYVTYMLKRRSKKDWDQSIDMQTLRLAPSLGPDRPVQS